MHRRLAVCLVVLVLAPVLAFADTPTAPAVTNVIGSLYPQEIVYTDEAGDLYVLSHDLVTQPGWPVAVGPDPTDAAVGDLTGDGVPAIAVGNGAGLVYAFDPAGQLLPRYPIDLGTGAPSRVSIGALGGPYYRNIVAVSGTEVFVLSGFGDVQQSWDLGATIVGTASFGDTDGDGVPEIVVATTGAIHTAHPGDGSAVLLRSFPGKTVSDKPTLGFLDADFDDVEIAVPTAEGDVYVIDGSGSDLGGFPYSYPAGGSVFEVAIAHVVGSSSRDLCVAQAGGVFHVLFNSGAPQSSFPQTFPDGFLAGPVTSRVNTSVGPVLIVPDTGDSLSATGNTGLPVAEFPYGVGESIPVPPAVYDLDGDLVVELVTVSDTQITRFDFVDHSPVQPPTIWPMRGHDAARTGCGDCPEFLPEVTGIGEGAVAGKGILRAPSPNPVRATGTRLSWSLAGPGRVSLEVFDLRGRAVRRLIDGARPAGEGSVTFDGRDDSGRDLASGLYFVRLTVDGDPATAASRKLQILR
jgi:hypothetical protein